MPRLITIFIFLFCGTMTALLVRSVLYPEASRLATVAPNVPFDLFASRTEGSRLDIWEANRILGSCELTPLVGESTPGVRRETTTVRAEIIVKIGQEIMEGLAQFHLHASGEVNDLSLDLSLPKAQPPVKLEIRQRSGRQWPALKLTRGSNVLFESTDGMPADGTYGAMVEMMLKSTGLSLDTLTEKTKPEKSPAATARAGHFEAGGESFDGYILIGGSGEENVFRLYLSNTGEIVRIDTPLTGANGLGLRLLSASLRPRGTEVPALNKFALPRRP